MKAPRLQRFIKRNLSGYLFIAPFFILFFIFVIAPVLISFGLSLTSYDMINPPKFIGLTNFRELILSDDVFLISLKNTLIFAVIAGPIGFLGSFIMAWLINNITAKPVRNLLSLAFYAPSITSSIALSVVWMYFFANDRYGLINNVLINLGIINDPIQWTTDSRYLLGVIIIISIWMSMGTGFLTFLAGLQNMNAELYEAGMIDGIRNNFQQLIYITLPQMKPQLLFGAINAAVTAFGVFDVSVAVAGMPSTNYAAHTIVAHLYDYAFLRFEMGYASAVSVFLFFFTFLLGRWFMKIFATKE